MKKVAFLISVILLVMVFFPVNASASSVESVDAFDSITSGDGQYIKDSYRDNYHLDIVKLGVLDSGDKIINSIANVLFSFIHLLAYITCVLFYHCFALNIAGLFGTQINELQSGLVSTLFQGLFILAFCATAFTMAVRVLKQDLQGALGEIAKVVVLVVMSVALTTSSASFLGFVNTATKEVSVQVMGQLSDTTTSGTTLNEYAADAAGILWGSLLHKPWIALEFGDNYTPSEREINDILSLPVGSQDRIDLIEDMNNSDGLFHKEVGGTRLGFCLLLLVVILFKAAIYILLALIQLCFQILTLVYVLLAPLILLLALIPSLGGMQLISSWLRKVLETQIAILIISFVIGIVVKFDVLIFENSGTYGWLIGMLIQIAVAILLYIKRGDIIRMMGGTTRAIQDPRIMLHKLQRSGNLYAMAADGPGHSRAHYNRSGGGRGGYDSYNTNDQGPRGLQKYSAAPQYQQDSGEALSELPAAQQQSRQSTEQGMPTADTATDQRQQSQHQQRENNVIAFSQIQAYREDRENIERPGILKDNEATAAKTAVPTYVEEDKGPERPVSASITVVPTTYDREAKEPERPVSASITVAAPTYDREDEGPERPASASITVAAPAYDQGDEGPERPASASIAVAAPTYDQADKEPERPAAALSPPSYATEAPRELERPAAALSPPSYATEAPRELERPAAALSPLSYATEAPRELERPAAAPAPPSYATEDPREPERPAAAPSPPSYATEDPREPERPAAAPSPPLPSYTEVLRELERPAATPTEKGTV